MFRQPLAPCVWLGAALGLVAAVAPATAFGQDRSTYERLDRLERDLNMLQRQVYRGGPPPPAGSHTANAEIRMDQLETQMRELTGRVEEVMHQVEQVRQRVEQMNSDLGVRVAQSPAGPGPVASAAPPAARPGSAVAAPRGRLPYPPPPESASPPDDDGGPLLPPGAMISPGGPMGGPFAGPAGGPTPIFGTLTPPGAAPPPRSPELAGAAPSGRPSAGGTLPGGSATEQYNYAFGLLKQANYPAAEEALKAFIEAHPKDPMAGTAQYWLGETYFTRNRFMEAATTFAEAYKRYPKGSKAPDSLLKLGTSLARANQKQNACVALHQLDRDFPQAGAAIKQSAAAEKKKLGC
jgi:tol-pal system protein YbgF